MTVVVEMKEAGQREPVACDVDALAAELCAYTCGGSGTPSQALSTRYAECKPSTGHLALYVNGVPVEGNVRVELADLEGPEFASVEACLEWCSDGEAGQEMKQSLAWTHGQSTFSGVTTRFQTCPNYPKIGFYALGYDYSAIAESSASWLTLDDIPKLESHFDFVRIANTRALAEGP